MPNFTQEQLQKITADIFQAGGVPSDEAAIIAELLVASNLAHVKASPTAPGFEEILTPGEIEACQTALRLRERIPINDETWRQIQATAAEVGIPELEF